MKGYFNTPLPTIDFNDPSPPAWDWPAPPVPCTLPPPAADGARAEPCRIEGLDGRATDGLLCGLDGGKNLIWLRTTSNDHAMELPLAAIRRITLTATLSRVPTGGPAQAEVLSSVQERDWRATMADGGRLEGRTWGHLKRAWGWFLFQPDARGQGFRRVFVPTASCRSLDFGQSAQEMAAQRWAGTREALVAAAKPKSGARVRRLGEVLMDLGLVTPAQIEEAVRQQGPQRIKPLGEVLVALGAIDRDELQFAFAIKLGTPAVDLERFPVERSLVADCAPQVLMSLRALPLMRDGQRLYVAVDELSRVPRLAELPQWDGYEIVPVLAQRAALKRSLKALAAAKPNDVWSHNVPTA